MVSNSSGTAESFQAANESGIVDFSEGWCDPFDCSDPGYLTVTWVARLLVVTGLGWTGYCVVQRRLRGWHELPWLTGSAILATVSFYRNPVHGYAEVPRSTVLIYALGAGVRALSNAAGSLVGPVPLKEGNPKRN